MVHSLLPQADRFSDQRTADPYWNESVWFSISKPEERHHSVELPLLQLGTPAGDAGGRGEVRHDGVQLAVGEGAGAPDTLMPFHRPP
jgi:hypothetical protein